MIKTGNHPTDKEGWEESLGLWLYQPEINSDTRRDIQLLLDDLRKLRSDDIEAGLEREKTLALNRTVVTALGG